VSFAEEIADVLEVGQLPLDLDELVAQALLHLQTLEPLADQRNLAIDRCYD
jgi:hypothetical protein